MHAAPPSTLAFARVRSKRYRLRRALGGAAVLGAAAVLALASSVAAAYTATLNPASPQTVYLQVGVGNFTNCYTCNPEGQPENDTTINNETVTVAATAVGNGTAQAMTTNSTATQSFWDYYVYCSVPTQLYIGGFYRTTGATTAAAQVVATVPTALTDTTGDTLPFSDIKWGSSGNGDTGGEPFPAGSFINGGEQSVGSMASNTWNESCWTFSYTNTKVLPAGTYTGVVLYTLSAP
jgi:hypothetical protein